MKRVNWEWFYSGTENSVENVYYYTTGRNENVKIHQLRIKV